MGYKLGYNNSDKYVTCSNGIYYFIRRIPTDILASQINRIKPPEVGDQVLEQLKKLTQGGIPRMLPVGLLLRKMLSK